MTVDPGAREALARYLPRDAAQYRPIAEATFAAIDADPSLLVVAVPYCETCGGDGGLWAGVKCRNCNFTGREPMVVLPRVVVDAVLRHCLDVCSAFEASDRAMVDLLHAVRDADNPEAGT
jgi:hypothetical protein